MVKAKLNSYHAHGNELKSLKEKLKLMKVDLKVWICEVFGNLDTTKKKILKVIEKLDIQDASSDLSKGDKLKRMDLISQLRVTNKKLESLFKQKARVNWFKHGDSNLKYYHYIIRWRRLRNAVKGVDVGGQWSEDSEVVRREVKTLFDNRFKATQNLGVRLGDVDFRSLSLEDSLSLISTFSMDEVKEAVWHVMNQKALGQMGSTLTSSRIVGMFSNMIL